MVTLPALRQELDLIPGPVMPDGQPSWTLIDPARAAYFRIDWLTYEVLCRWSLGDASVIAARIAQETTLTPSPQDIANIEAFASAQQWIQPRGEQVIKAMAERLKHGNPGFWTRILHQYLFFRVPLVKPDAFLSKALPLVSILFSRTFFRLTLLVFVVGLWQVSRQWDRFQTQLIDTFSWSGLAGYAVAIVLIKAIHELGHAFTAKRLGCRVPTMGIAFMVMWPMAYTDTNDTWRLHRNKDRLRVAAAGITTELIIAVWCTLAWSFLQDGPLRSAVFVLATTSWVTTLMINASPFMRFDGYFILSDAVDMPNLHQRSFDMARWYAQHLLFGVSTPYPEPVTKRRARAMALFGVATLLYRLILFVGIALVVYHFFFKALGIFLFLVEIYWFILRPLKTELYRWYQQRDSLVQSGRAPATALVLITLILLPVMPWPNRIHTTALLYPQGTQTVYTPDATEISSLKVVEGQKVAQGDLLVKLNTPSLDRSQASLEGRIEALIKQSNAQSLSVDKASRIATAKSELQTAFAERDQLKADRSQFEITANFNGVVRDIEPNLRAGIWLSGRTRILTVVPNNPMWQIETWVTERQLKDLRVGATAQFWPRSLSGPELSAVIKNIDYDATRELTRPELAAQLGGHIEARNTDGRWIPEQAIYRVSLEPITPSHIPQDTRAWRGELSIQGQWRSPLTPYLEHALAVMWRELSF